MEQANIQNKVTKVTEIDVALDQEKNIEVGVTSSPYCPHCRSDNVYGMSRVVGYFSVIENWNDSKKSELKRRQKGNYWSEEI